MLSNIPALILNQNCNVVAKEMSHCHKLKFSNHYIFATQCRRPSIFQTLISVTINNLSLKFQKFKPTGCEDKGILKNLSLWQKLNSFTCMVLTLFMF